MKFGIFLKIGLPGVLSFRIELLFSFLMTQKRLINNSVLHLLHIKIINPDQNLSKNIFYTLVQQKKARGIIYKMEYITKWNLEFSWKQVSLAF